MLYYLGVQHYGFDICVYSKMSLTIRGHFVSLTLATMNGKIKITAIANIK